MAVTNYYSVRGEIIGEHTAGQSRLDYLPDGLGSVIATIDQTLTVKSTARFKPYGADLATTGTVTSFGWAGVSGYRRTSRPHADIYIRARTDSTSDGRWISLDPLWPNTSAYLYAGANPIRVIDYFGLQSGNEGTVCPPEQRPAAPPNYDQAPRGLPNDRSSDLPTVPPTCSTCIIVMGAIACVEMCIYNQTGRAAGPCTGLGVFLGTCLFSGHEGKEHPLRRPSRVVETNDCLKAKSQVTQLCKGQARSCSKLKRSKLYTDEQWCQLLKEYYNRQSDCLKARKQVTRVCYGGITDQTHAGQEAEIRAGRKACLQAMVDSRCFLP